LPVRQHFPRPFLPPVLPPLRAVPQSGPLSRSGARAGFGTALAFPFGMDIRGYLFGGETRQLAYKSLDASVLRAKAISQNLANIQTPGYERKEVNFEEQLQNALRAKLAAAQDQNGHMPAGKGIDLTKIQPFIYEPKDPTLPGEINNVDVDMEASKMAENQIYYSFLTKFVGFDKLMSAISGRGAG
jgi:flagellar basal-body rod protein FlgB